MVGVTGMVAVVALVELAAPAAQLLPPRKPRPSYTDAHTRYRPPPTQPEISAVIRGNRAGINACYQRALVGDKTLSDASMVMKLIIGISGRVKHVGVEGPPQFRQVEPCFREVVGRWVFPQTSEEYSAAFPVVFRAGEVEDVAAEQVSVPETCLISVDSVPWSQLWIDGKGTDRRTPIIDLVVTCGQHKLGFKRADLHINRTHVIKVRPRKPFKQSYRLTADELNRRR